MRTIEIRVEPRRLPLSTAAIHALHTLSQYDIIAFTSKNAYSLFIQELKRRHIAPPLAHQIVRVGPRNDLLRFSVNSKKVLFPRSALAPHDIVRKLRARGARVRVIPLYTVRAIPLSKNQRTALAQGTIEKFFFRSPSGIHGLLAQLRGKLRARALGIEAHCIGATTARAARKAGFKKVSIKSV